MDDDYWYRRVWKVLDAEGQSGFILEAENEFWLEPQFVDDSDEPAYYEVKFEPGKMKNVWAGTRVYPLGVTDPQLAEKLQPFNPSQKRKYMTTAKNKAEEASSLTVRLEGVVKNLQPADVACFYVFPSATTAGRDWIVIDVKKGLTMKQDGTAHGDPK